MSIPSKGQLMCRTVQIKSPSLVSLASQSASESQ
uniref:Uncharacterized protein n=2 Tax=Anguilla anguilla TaxID=7936 RepID=A0A0E9U8J0_ANGAN